ncbi:MAG: hypothetical protein IK004_00915 [Bacteroidales bacterium]|nr:hypothetical protein [Bacteroidales bacterium]
MKNHLSKITILFAAIISVLLVSCIGRNSKQYYKTPTGKVITKYGDYFIFEKYKGYSHPQSNYIKINPYSNVSMFFKSNDSIIILRRGDENSLEIGLNRDKYKIEVYCNEIDDIHEFQRRSSFADSLAILEFDYTPMHELFDRYYITVRECVGDKVYTRFFRNNPHNYKVYERSRYDAIK